MSLKTLSVEDICHKEHFVELHSLKSGAFPLTQISPIEDIHAQSVVLIKNAKFFSKFSALYPENVFHDVAVVLPTAYFSKFKEGSEEISSLKNQFGAILLSSNMDMSTVNLAQTFYELNYKEHNHFVDGRQMGTAEIHPTADLAQNVFIGDQVEIGENVTIMPGCVILGPSKILKGTKIYPNVSIYEGTEVGRECIIHSGTVIGADGFGYSFDGKEHRKIFHRGGVIIGDQVEIGANSCIDRGTFSSTIVGSGTKIDNHVQVAHNCRIGHGCILCGHVALGGSTVLGDFTLMGGKSTTAPGIELGKGVQVTGGTAVARSFPAGSILGGYPAEPVKDWRAQIVALKRLIRKKK